MLFKERSINILPFNGECYYYGEVFNELEANLLYERLKNEIDWKNDAVMLFGRKIITRRKVAWYGDHEFEYKYSGVTKKALIWNSLLLEIKKVVEDISMEKYNSCLLNFYNDGNDGMSWHSDNESTLEKNSAIASLSFGSERFFNFKHKHKLEKVKIKLEHASLLVMKGETQTYWLHSVPKSKKIELPRINLTFRKFTEL